MCVKNSNGNQMRKRHVKKYQFLILIDMKFPSIKKVFKNIFQMLKKILLKGFRKMFDTYLMVLKKKQQF